MKYLSKYRRLLQSIQAVLANSRRKSKLKIKEKIWLNSTRVVLFHFNIRVYRIKQDREDHSIVKLGN